MHIQLLSCELREYKSLFQERAECFKFRKSTFLHYFFIPPTPIFNCLILFQIFIFSIAKALFMGKSS